MSTGPTLFLPTVLGNPSLPRVPYDVSLRPLEFEKDVTNHYLFDSSDNTCLTGGYGGALTPNGAAPIYTGALANTPPAGGTYLKVADGGMNGLITPYAEQDTQTQWVVVRKDALTGSFTDIILFGTFSSADTTSGHMAYLQGGMFDVSRTSGGNSTSAQLASTAAPPVNTTWLFVAVATAPGSRMTYVGGIGTQTDTPTKISSIRNNAIGNAFFSVAAWQQGPRVAEYGLVLGSKLSQAALDQIYGRAKVRMTDRGVPLF
ncbi:hypothetical protein [Novosphingobium sp. FKTRR1]|uniref:hypothetical protein n=1 Tax=Novosphingobium sp. FKTRR1 TaxID=2879118 RepID=UPI001CEFDFAC|nr:hypothetical protein [Novosphingobium sp. FKTRR1]